MAPVVIFICALVIVAFVVPAVIAHGRRDDAVWLEAATTLGLGFQPSGFLQRCRISGSMADLEITLDTFTRGSGKNRRTYTRLHVMFPVALDLGLRLSRNGFVSGVAKLFGAQDVELGAREFESSIIVKGSDPSRVKDFLTMARRARIYRLLSNFSETTIDDQGIKWRQLGVMKDAGEMARIIRRFQAVAWYLIADRKGDQLLTEALVAADLGHPGEAFNLLDDRVVDDAGAVPQDVEKDIVRGHLLYLAGRDRESQAAFSTATAKAPEDPEAARWSERLFQGEPPGPNDAESPPSSEGGETFVTTEELYATVFRDEGTTFEANRRFERHFSGKRVSWEGKLDKVESCDVDFVFNQRDACKAIFTVMQTDSVPFGSREVLAVVQLPGEAVETLGSHVGESVRFSGRLFKIDSFLRNVYVDAGVMVKS